MSKKEIRLSSNEAIDQNGGAPSRLMILNTEKFYIYGEKLQFRKKDFKAMIKNFKEKTIGHEIPVNYGHGGYRADGRAAGWIKGLDIEENRLMADIEWNAKGKEAVEAKEYAYHSIGATMSSTDPRDGSTEKGAILFELSLTNRPANVHIESLVELEKEIEEDQEMNEKEKLELEKGRLELAAQKGELEAAKKEIEAARGEIVKEKLKLSRERRETELESFVSNKNITPAQRDKALELSSSAYEGFKLAIPETKLDIQTTPKGIGNNGEGEEILAEKAGEEVHRLAVKLEKEEGIEYGDAVDRVLDNDPELAKQYK